MILTQAQKIEACARAAHEVNRVYCLMLGDTSQQGWDDAPHWQRDSCRKGVAMALNGATPEESHKGWLEEKRLTGWKYGPVKDVDKKEHPCFMPYDQLSPAQRKKDGLYLAVVRAMGAALDPT